VCSRLAASTTKWSYENHKTGGLPLCVFDSFLLYDRVACSVNADEHGVAVGRLVGRQVDGTHWII
jgi:hypothetical protein